MTATARIRLGLLAALGCLSSLAVPAAPAFSEIDRGNGRQMLAAIRHELDTLHYDPARIRTELPPLLERAERQIAEARSHADVFTAIGGALRGLKDSHTGFLPPSRAADYNYGWTAESHGNHCYIVDVEAGSDAAAQGVLRGDRLVALDGAPINRAAWPAWDYFLRLIAPRAHLDLTLAAPGAEPRQVRVATAVKARPRRLQAGLDYGRLVAESEARTEQYRSSFAVYDGVLLWRLRQFFHDEEDLETGLRRLPAHAAVILDLRGNPGGSETTLQTLAGAFLPAEATVGHVRTRDKTEPFVIKPRRSGAWQGKLSVLVDAQSQSAAEIFAAIIKLQERGFVFGDRTAGAVQRSVIRPHRVGDQELVFYAVSVAVSDFTLRSGYRPEGRGIAPDYPVPVTGADLAGSRDPVLAAALKHAGVIRDPAELGRDTAAARPRPESAKSR